MARRLVTTPYALGDPRRSGLVRRPAMCPATAGYTRGGAPAPSDFGTVMGPSGIARSASSKGALARRGQGRSRRTRGVGRRGVCEDKAPEADPRGDSRRTRQGARRRPARRRAGQGRLPRAASEGAGTGRAHRRKVGQAPVGGRCIPHCRTWARRACRAGPTTEDARPPNRGRVERPQPAARWRPEEPWLDRLTLPSTGEVLPRLCEALGGAERGGPRALLRAG
jgi:hypothetical protein